MVVSLKAICETTTNQWFPFPPLIIITNSISLSLFTFLYTFMHFSYQISPMHPGPVFRFSVSCILSSHVSHHLHSSSFWTFQSFCFSFGDVVFPFLCMIVPSRVVSSPTILSFVTLSVHHFIFFTSLQHPISKVFVSRILNTRIQNNKLMIN